MNIAAPSIALFLGIMVAGLPSSFTDARLIERLVGAYPGQLVASPEGIVWTDGTRTSFHEKKAGVSPQGPDLSEQMAEEYPGGAFGALTAAPDTDPGRVRSQAFFMKMYGATPEAVERQLVTVPWLSLDGGRPIRVTRVNGVDRRIKAISKAIEALSESDRRCAVRQAGGYAWRVVAGTTDLSPHSFGIAVDLDTSCSEYWRWQPGARHPWTHRPLPFADALVDIFESHGFIWGAKWHRFDTMHFEYRPELLRPKVDIQSLL